MDPTNPLSWRIPIMLGKTLTSSPPPWDVALLNGAPSPPKAPSQAKRFMAITTSFEVEESFRNMAPWNIYKVTNHFGGTWSQFSGVSYLQRGFGPRYDLKSLVPFITPDLKKPKGGWQLGHCLEEPEAQCIPSGWILSGRPSNCSDSRLIVWYYNARIWHIVF